MVSTPAPAFNPHAEQLKNTPDDAALCIVCGNAPRRCTPTDFAFCPGFALLKRTPTDGDIRTLLDHEPRVDRLVVIQYIIGFPTRTSILIKWLIDAVHRSAPNIMLPDVLQVIQSAAQVAAEYRATQAPRSFESPFTGPRPYASPSPSPPLVHGHGVLGAATIREILDEVFGVPAAMLGAAAVDPLRETATLERLKIALVAIDGILPMFPKPPEATYLKHARLVIADEIEDRQPS